MWNYKRVTRTTLIALAGASFLGGLGLVQLGWAAEPWLLAVAALLALLTLRRRLFIAVPAVIIAGIICGVWRGAATQTSMQPYAVLRDSPISLTGTVVDDPMYDEKGQLDFRVTSVVLEGQSLPGTVRIKSFSFVDVTRGDSVTATGTLRDGFGNYQASMYFASIELQTENTDPLDSLRRSFAAAILSAMPDPQASLGLGFLLGLKTGLPDELSDQLKILGLTHIVVASGFNLTILIRIVRRLFAQHSKFQTVFFAGTLMSGFVVVTGFSPSMSRAALVTSLALAAWYFGRRIHPATLLLFAAGVTAALNPLYVWYDLGWWLSFLAFAGVLIIAPLLQKRLLGEKTPLLLQVVIETFAAQLMVTPLILWVFGDLAVISLLANTLIVPFIPLAMALVFLVGLSGLLAPWLAALVAVPATWLITYMTELTRILSAIPWATADLPIHLSVMLGCYGCIGLTIFLLARRLQYDYLKGSVVE